MNKEKQTYLSPETETLVVRFEGVICQSYGAQGTEKSNDRDAISEGFFFN